MKQHKEKLTPSLQILRELTENNLNNNNNINKNNINNNNNFINSNNNDNNNVKNSNKETVVRINEDPPSPHSSSSDSNSYEASDGDDRSPSPPPTYGLSTSQEFAPIIGLVPPVLPAPKLPPSPKTSKQSKIPTPRIPQNTPRISSTPRISTPRNSSSPRHRKTPRTPRISTTPRISYTPRNTSNQTPREKKIRHHHDGPVSIDLIHLFLTNQLTMKELLQYLNEQQNQLIADIENIKLQEVQVHAKLRKIIAGL